MAVNGRSIHTCSSSCCIEIDAAQRPRALPDVAAAVRNANYAFEAHLSPTKDGLFVR